MLYKPFFPLSLGEVKTKSCLSGLCMVGKGGGSVKRVQMEVEVPGSSHVAIASLWPPPIAMAPIVMSVVGCVSILEGQPWPWAPAQLPPRPECTLTICAHLSNDEKALPSPAVCVWGGGGSHQREQQEMLGLSGDPTVGQGGKVIASRASKGSSECMKAWSSISAFLLVLTL